MFNELLLTRIYERVIVDEVTGCHLWQGNTDGRAEPYGRVSVKGATVAVHIAIFRIFKGRKPKKGYDVDHGCTNRLCINYDHLREVTKLKNQRLRVKRSKLKGDVFKCLAVK